MTKQPNREKRGLISVIVPVYKTEAYLEESVRSITSQEYTNLEIILVDDGSPDACPGICDALAKEDTRIQVIHQGNAGVSQARNAGLEVAQGEYVSFVDSDDVIHPMMYTNLYNALIEYDADVVSCNLRKFQEHDEPFLQREMNEGKIECLSSYEMMRRSLLRICPDGHMLLNKLGKRSILTGAGISFLPGVLYGEDVFVAVSMCANAKKIVLITQELYGYRQRKGSATAQRDNFEEKFPFIELTHDLEEEMIRRLHPGLDKELAMARVIMWTGQLHAVFYAESWSNWKGKADELRGKILAKRKEILHSSCMPMPWKVSTLALWPGVSFYRLLHRMRTRLRSKRH